MSNRRQFSSKTKRLIVQFSLLVILIFSDLFVKKIVQKYLAPVGTIPIIKNVFDFTYVENTGMAWGLLNQKSGLLSLIVGFVLLVMLVYIFLTKDNHVFWHICFSFIIGGGAANLIDRLLNGFVTDYFHVLFVDFPVFNLADCFIVVGCFSLIIYLIVDMIYEYKKKDAGVAANE